MIEQLNTIDYDDEEFEVNAKTPNVSNENKIFHNSYFIKKKHCIIAVLFLCYYVSNSYHSILT